MRPTAGTRDRTIEAARQLFWERGYEVTTLAQVADRADVNSGSLYYFFRSKEQLLLAVLDRYVEMLFPMVVEPALKSTHDPVERIFALLQGYRQGLLRSGFVGGCPIGNLALEVSDSLPSARAKVALNFSNWRSWVEKLLLDAGEPLASEIDPHNMAAFVLAVMEGAVMQARAFRSIEPFDAAIETLRDYVRRVLKQKKETEQK
jgi:TetR/AcrR family transcriptional repressor of nem operon